MKLRLLGPTEVVGDDGRTVKLPRGRARSLLALLALHPGEVLSTDRLIDALWGDEAPATAITALQGHVSALRKRLEPDRTRGQAAAILVTHPPGYVLAIDRAGVDAERFRRLVDETMGAPAPRRALRLRRALALWRGPALADFVYEPFAQAAIAALEGLRSRALEARIEADLELGRHADVVAELEALVAEHPLHEGFHGHLMVALYRCGRQARALQTYRDVQRHLVGELGIDPSPRLQALERAILEQHPSLAPPERMHAPDMAELEEDTAGAWLDAGRRTVTLAVVDVSVAGSSAESDTDPELVRPLVTRAHHAVRAVMERHGGSVHGVIGDVIAVMFGLPVAHEDDAARAVHAAAAVRRDLSEVNEEAERVHGVWLRARIGIDTGEVVVDATAGEAATSGPLFARAARLQQAADDGDVLVGEATRRLVETIARVAPARGQGSAPVWSLIDVAGVPAELVASDSAFVGRQGERTALVDALDHVVGTARTSLVTVLGEAGIGKSRLARAFTQETTDVRVVVGRCRAYGDGITYWPVREIVQDLVGSAGPDGLVEMLGGEPDGPTNAAQIAAAVGLSVDEVERPGELFRAFRQLFEVAARNEPLVAIVEDAHWAEPTLLDLVEYLTAEAHGPLLLLCIARPELIGDRPRWASEIAATTISLEPLPTSEARQLVIERLGGRPLAPETMGQVLALSQGNPLFLEQLLAAMRDDDGPGMPPTIKALLTARLDRLGPAEKDLLRAASVVGTDVSLEALAVLVPTAARRYLRRHLTTLTAKALIRRWDGSRSDSAGFDFGHVLIQQAAYRSLTHNDRAELHERLATWLERDSRGAHTEVEELVGHHLEQAFLHRTDLGRSDPETTQLAIRAGELLASAGLRAYARFDVPAAQNLLSRARVLLPAGHGERRRVLRRLAEAHPVMGRRDEAEEVFTELLEIAEQSGDDQIVRSVRLEQARFRLITGPDPIALATIQAEAQEALDAFDNAGDAVGVSQAHYVLASVHLRGGRIAVLEEIGRRGLERARRTGDLRERLGAPWWVVFALLEGPTAVSTCIRTCEDIADVGGLTHLGVLAALGHFKAMIGAFAEGRRLAVQARQLLRERIRIPRPLAFIGQCSAGIEQLAGRPDAAARALREALDVARHVSDRDQTAQIAGRLSLLLADQGDAEEAGHLAALASHAAPAESVAAQALTRAAAARTALDDQDLEEAHALIRGAIGVVPSEMLDLRALLHRNLAKVAAASGRADEARSIADQAIELYERKGNMVAARRMAEAVGSGHPRPALQARSQWDDTSLPRWC